LVGDESGTLVVPHKGDDRFFVVATVMIPRTARLSPKMRALRRAVLPFLESGAPAYFHAKEDTPITKRQLLTLLAAQPLEIDVTVMDKEDLPAPLKPIELYSVAWYEHLVHALPGLLVPRYSKILLQIARLHEAAQRQAFGTAFVEATMVGYVPFMYWHSQSTSAQPAATNPGQQIYFGPSLIFGEQQASDRMLIQAADVVAWAARRKWAVGDSSYYELIRPRVRSERLLQIIPNSLMDRLPRYRVGVMLPLKGARSFVHDYYAAAQYEIGPADSFQRVVWTEQLLNLGKVAEAAAAAAAVDEGQVVAEGLVAWPTVARGFEAWRRDPHGAPPIVP
jgi:hypothetical protein